MGPFCWWSGSPFWCTSAKWLTPENGDPTSIIHDEVQGIGECVTPQTWLPLDWTRPSWRGHQNGVRQAEGPFVAYLLDFLYFSVELFANFCLGLSGIFGDFFLLTSYDPCALDLSRALIAGQSWYSM